MRVSHILSDRNRVLSFGATGRKLLSSLVFVFLAVSAIAQDQPTAAGAQTPGELRVLLASKKAELAQLSHEATEVTHELGVVAAKSQSTSRDSVEQLKELVDKLAKISDKLDALQKEVQGIQARIQQIPKIEDQIRDLDERLNVAANQPVAIFGYGQAQYQALEGFRQSLTGSGADAGLSMRRMRVGVRASTDQESFVQITWDMAQGTYEGEVKNSLELKDAVLSYRPSKFWPGWDLAFTVGQLPIPLGYEIPRSDADYEFPERSIYNRFEFEGERSQGGYFDAESGHWAFIGGAFNSLTINDLERPAIPANISEGLAGVAAARYNSSPADFGVSGFVGTRPTFTAYSGLNVPEGASAPSAVRSFLYGDATIHSLPVLLHQPITWRVEGMYGHDRVPGFTLGSHAMAGLDATATSELSKTYDLSVRYQRFDQDLGGDESLRTGVGIALTYHHPGPLSVLLAHEFFRNVNSEPYSATTLRAQIRF